MCGVDEFTHWPHCVGLQNMMRRLCLIIVPVSPHVPASRYTCKPANTNTGVTGGTPHSLENSSANTKATWRSTFGNNWILYLLLLAVLQTGGRMKLQIEPLREGVERGLEEAATGDVTTAWSVIRAAEIVRTPGHGQDVALLIVKFSNFDSVRHQYSQYSEMAPCWKLLLSTFT